LPFYLNLSHQIAYIRTWGNKICSECNVNHGNVINVHKPFSNSLILLNYFTPLNQRNNNVKYKFTDVLNIVNERWVTEFLCLYLCFRYMYGENLCHCLAFVFTCLLCPLYNLLKKQNVICDKWKII
jgi:hypothetical protein